MGILGKIFGAEEVIKSGLDLIDDMHTSDEEEIAAKAKAKVDLLNAYAPFKLAQRYLAFMFTFMFLLSIHVKINLEINIAVKSEESIPMINVVANP